jgi:flagellar M-ring protein FliF
MDLKTLVAQLVSLFDGLEKQQRIIIGVTLGVVIAFLVFIMVYTAKPSGEDGYKVLFENLSGKDASAVIEHLKTEQIEYRVRKNNTIEIPSDIVYEQRIKIAGMGLPKESKVGFELFDVQEFGATAFDQQVKYLRALEGELARTIEGLDPIASAKVHIALPKESLFVTKGTPPTASVVLNFQPNRVLSRKQVFGIKNLVASSVTKLEAMNVTVVNSEGEALGDDDEATKSDERAAMQLRYKRKLEREYETKVVSVVAPLLGSRERVVAKVTIDFDFSQKSSTEEQFDPENVVRSEQTLEEKREGMKPKEIGGVPGAVSNIGPVEGLQSGNNSELYEKNSVATNYEISKKVSQTVGEFAVIKRVSTAVVVDGIYRKKMDENGNELDEYQYVALDQTQMDSLTNVIRRSVGFNQERGDDVAVTNFQFKTTSMTHTKLTPYEHAIEQARYFLGPIEPLLKYLIVGIILFVLYKTVIMPFAAKMLEVHKEEEDEERRPLIDIDEEEEEDLVAKVQEMRKKVEDQLGVGEGYNEEELKHDVLVEKIRSMIEEKPADIAAVLGSLISEDGYDQQGGE